METQIYNTAGSLNWTAPAGVYEIQVECWGGGGNGGQGGGDGTEGASGGGGGAYAKKNIIHVIPGLSYLVVVGGVAADSYFIDISTVLAKGGTSAVWKTIGIGGAAASCVGDVKYSGGNGGQFTANESAAGGGAAGPDGNGNAGGGSGGNGGSGDAGYGGAGGINPRGAGGSNVLGGGGGAGGENNDYGGVGGVPGGAGGGGEVTKGLGKNGQVRITYVTELEKFFQMF